MASDKPTFFGALIGKRAAPPPAPPRLAVILARVVDDDERGDSPAVRYALTRAARLGFDAEALNFGRVRCLLPHEHGTDGRCSARVSSSGDAIWIRIFPDTETAARRLWQIARARTLSARPAPLCPQCGKQDAQRCDGLGSVVDDIQDKAADLKSKAGMVWDLCSFCRKVGATLGGAPAAGEPDVGAVAQVGAQLVTDAAGDMDDDHDHGAQDDGNGNVGGYRSRDHARRNPAPLEASHELPDLGAVANDRAPTVYVSNTPITDMGPPSFQYQAPGAAVAQPESPATVAVRALASLTKAWETVIAKLDASPPTCACRATVEPLVADWRRFRATAAQQVGVPDLAAQWAKLRQAQAAQGDAPAPDVLRPDDVILDVRTAREFNEKHLDGAQNIPIDELPDRMGDLARSAGQRRIVVFCAAGLRAARAVFMLRQAGFDACSGHKDPECGCDVGRPDDPPGWRRETSPDGRVTIVRDEGGAEASDTQGESDNAGAVARLRFAPGIRVRAGQYELVPGIRADDLLTPQQRAQGITFANLMETGRANQRQVNAALARGLLRRFANLAGADMDTVEGKVTEIAAAWDGLRDLAARGGPLALAIGRPYARWQGDLVAYQRSGQIDLDAALDDLGSWIPDAVNPWAPSDEAKAKVDELAKKWPELEAKMAADPKIDRALRQQHDHWIEFKKKWDGGDRDVNDLRMAVQDYDVAHANAFGVLTQNDPGRMADIASERLTAARGAAQATDEAVNAAAAKAKAVADDAGGMLKRYKWPLLAASGALVLVVLRR